MASSTAFRVLPLRASGIIPELVVEEEEENFVSRKKKKTFRYAKHLGPGGGLKWPSGKGSTK
jgi:hypothetical protein